MAWLNPFVSDLEGTEHNVTLGMYYNYADPSLSTHDAHKRYWLQNYKRLAEIKRVVDPDLVFLNPQTVGTE
jgi:FAD/FMN-containing dehydrogenase